MLVQTLFTILAGLVAWQIFDYARFRYKCSQTKVPGYRQYIFFGHLAIRMFPNLMRPFYEHGAEIFQHNNGMYSKFKTSLISYVCGRVTIYWVKDPEYIRRITVSDRKHFTKPIKSYKVLDHFGKNILTTNDDTWKRHRLVANPAFSDANQKLVANSTVVNVHRMFQRWSENKTTCQDGRVGFDVENALHDTALLTFAVIAKAGFGQDLNPFVESSQDNQFGRVFRTVLHNVYIRLGLPDFVFKLPVWRFPEISSAFTEFESFLKKVIQEKRAALAEGASTEDDLMSMLLNAVPDAELDHDSKVSGKSASGRKVALSDEEVFADTFMFFLAGHETTASTLAWALCYLALNPHVFRKLQAEADAVLGNRDPTIDDVPNLIYSACVFKETLRLVPPVPIIPKATVTEYKIGEYTIPKDVMVGLDCYSMQRDEKYFPEPLVFKPERHDTRVSPDLTRYTFVPFSVGQRSCIGRRFAQVEAIITLSMIAQKYDLSFAPDVNPFELMRFHYMLSIQPQKPVHLFFKPRLD